MSENEEPWMSNPMMIDQSEGFTFTDEVVYQMQVQRPNGQWVQFNSERRDRDEVTRIQADDMRRRPDETPLRVWKREVVWTMEEVPGYGYGKTAPEEILARNEEITKRLLDTENKQQSGQ